MVISIGGLGTGEIGEADEKQKGDKVPHFERISPWSCRVVISGISARQTLLVSHFTEQGRARIEWRPRCWETMEEGQDVSTGEYVRSSGL
jgi:hypothetical protein